MERPLPSFGLEFEEMVVPRLLERRAAQTPDRDFLVFDEESWTFGAVDSAASRLAGGLASIGVEKDAKVALFLPNCPDFINMFFAIAKLGAASAPINTAYRGYMLEYVLNDTACRYLVADADYLDRIRDALPNLQHLECVIVRGEQAADVVLDGIRTVSLAD
ncbi:MAG TPA: AMP-binding protein, partial [Gaiellaceae bacterium]|nr:AMP-binding protein [Gaiellaceae bacterium]